MKKLLGILLVLALVLSFSLVATTPVAADTITVGPTGDYATIQEAINAANPAGGDTIIVAADTYAESVIVNKSVLLLSNPGAVLAGTGTGNGLLIQAPDVTIDGFEITNYSIGIRTYGGPSNFGDLNILNCYIHNNTQNGIAILHDTFDTVVLDNCEISSNSQNGIGIANQASVGDLQIVDCEILANGHHGLYIANISTAIAGMTVTDTDMIGNTYSAITIDSGSSVSSASFADCRLDGSDINFVVRGATTTVTDLTMVNTSLSYSATNHGFHLRDGTIDGLAFDNVTMANNRYQGFFVSNGATLIDASIAGGAIEGNEFGLLTQASTITNLAVEEVPIRNNTGSGLSVATGTVTGLIVQYCDFQNNAWEHLDLGIGWMGALTIADVTVTYNTFGPGPWACLYVPSTASFAADDIAVTRNNFVSGAWGVFNGAATTIDATLNWWGDASGPGGVGLGSGDAASMYVDFMPWLMEEDGTDTTETNTDFGVGASASTTNVEATATGGNAGTTVTVGEYVGNPTGASPGFRSGAVYIDVHVGGPAPLPTQLVVEVACPGGICSGVVLQWWNGTAWVPVVAPTSVVSGNIQVVLSATSSPTIAQLTGTILGLGGLSTVGWEGSSVDKAAVMVPWIALLTTMMAGATLLVVRRRRAQI